MRRANFAVLFVCGLVIASAVTGCDRSRSDHNGEGSTLRQPQASSRSQVQSVDVRASLRTVEQFVENGGYEWFVDEAGEDGALVVRCRTGECRELAVDFDLLTELPNSERSRIVSMTIRGVTLSYSNLDFSQFPNLRGAFFSRTNLNTLNGMDHLQLRSLQLVEIPVVDLSSLAGLSQAERIAVVSTEPARLPNDLSTLAQIEEFHIDASPLETLDGIETIPTDFHLIVGDVNDISAIARSNATWVTMPVEVQERFPEEVAALNEMGIAVTDAFE